MSKGMSTYKTALMSKESAEWKQLVEIKDYPALGGEPEMLDKTTLVERIHTYVEGIGDTGALTFTANYNLEDYKKLAALKGKMLELAVWFGGTVDESGAFTPDGSDGKFGFSGTVSVYVDGGGVNAVRDMKVTVTPATEITLDEE